MVQYEVIVIGTELSGLTVASLLAKRGLRVAVIDKAYDPDGSCGVSTSWATGLACRNSSEPDG